MNEERRYATPAALRSAITDRLRSIVSEDPSLSLADLRRQFAYDRLLYRIFTGHDRDRWVLKGATALLARLRGRARHSIDIDLFSQTGSLEEAEAALRAAADREGGDHFRFVLPPAGVSLKAGSRCGSRQPSTWGRPSSSDSTSTSLPDPG